MQLNNHPTIYVTIQPSIHAFKSKLNLPSMFNFQNNFPAFQTTIQLSISHHGQLQTCIVWFPTTLSFPKHYSKQQFHKMKLPKSISASRVAVWSSARRSAPVSTVVWFVCETYGLSKRRQKLAILIVIFQIRLPHLWAPLLLLLPQPSPGPHTTDALLTDFKTVIKLNTLWFFKVFMLITT